MHIKNETKSRYKQKNIKTMSRPENHKIYQLKGCGCTVRRMRTVRVNLTDQPKVSVKIHCQRCTKRKFLGINLFKLESKVTGIALLFDACTPRQPPCRISLRINTKFDVVWCHSSFCLNRL